MNDGDAPPESRGGLFGAFLLVVGLFTLFAVRGIRDLTLAASGDPGPRSVPTILAVALILGGAAEVIAAGIKSRRARAAGAANTAAPAEDSNRMDAWIVVAALIIYIAALPWIGFNLCTLAFAITMMWRLQTGWILNLAVSFGLVIAVHVLFVMAFRVQLPRGELGLPF